MDDIKLRTMEAIRASFFEVSTRYLAIGNSLEDLEAIVRSLEIEKVKDSSRSMGLTFKTTALIASVLAILLSITELGIFERVVIFGRERRCLVPNNYFVWEFTRPVSNCDFCRDVTEPIILTNLTRRDFEFWAYSSRPIIVKNATDRWPARKMFDLEFFRRVYESVDGDEAYATLEDDCQFLQFKSQFYRLRDVLETKRKNGGNYSGVDEPWYVGWKNCHHAVLEIVNRFYENPHFFPADAEIPATNYIFLGYEQGAVMHLDYIPRLMWQAQIIGRKTWTVAPTPECEKVCGSFDFTVDTGDIVLLDTRIWYHGTHVDNGLFSLSLTSEYG